METCGSDFLVAYDFDAVMAIIDADFREQHRNVIRGAKINVDFREQHRNVIRGKLCCQKPTISKELSTTPLPYLLKNLPIRIRIVEACKIKTSR